jgi:ABC-type lipoprotein release transport system permease subunit
LVLAMGLRLIALGILTGAVIALANVRWLAFLLYGIRLSDSIPLSLVPMLLAAVGLLACAIPALRAARLDPVVVLRQE